MKNLKVILTLGIPGSGKSTWAKEFISKNEGYVRVNRDDFRLMLKNAQVCEPKIENLITELCDNLIVTSLSKKLNVIVDNTHLKKSYINHIKELVHEYADVEYIMFDTSVEKCIERDNARDKKVGEAVIRKMNKDFLVLKDSFDFQFVSKSRHRKVISPNFKSDLQDAVCFDIDGTLANMGDRSPFDWKKVDRDHLNPIVAEHVKFHRDLGRKIIIMSGRDAVCKDITEEWLKFYGIEYDHIFMRPEDDFRKDNIIKKEIYENNIKDKFNLLCVYDDRLQVVKMWYEEGIFCFNVNSGNKIF